MPSTFANMFAPGGQLGTQLNNLVNQLYAGDSPTKLAEREAAIAEKRAQAQLRAAQMREYEAKEQERSLQRAERAAAPLALAEAMFPGQGQAVTDYRKAGGIVQPQAETADMPGIVGGYEMDRPRGYTPQAEDSLSRLLTTMAMSGALPGKSNVQQATAAAGALQNQNLIADVLANIRTPEAVSSAVAAGKGSELYKDNQGRVLDLRRGTLDESGAQAVAGVAETNAKADKERAQAGRSRRDDAPLVQVLQTKPDGTQGYVWSKRGDAVGQAAPIPGAQKVTDTLFPQKPTATNMTRAQQSDQDAASTLAIIASAREIAKDPRNFGFSGILRNTVQDAIQQGQALGMTLGGEAQRIQQDIARYGSDVGLENFDPTLPQLDMMTNILAFRMAKMNDPAGRVTDQDFRIAKNQVGGRGFLANQKEFISRLDLFENMLKDQRSRDQMFMSGGRKPQPSAADYNYAPAPASAPTVTNW